MKLANAQSVCEKYANIYDRDLSDHFLYYKLV